MSGVAAKSRKVKEVGAPKPVRSAKVKVPVSELNVRKAATRVLGVKLVTPEVEYVQRELGATATQDDLDAKVRAVRALPWASIVLPE